MNIRTLFRALLAAGGIAFLASQARCDSMISGGTPVTGVPPTNGFLSLVYTATETGFGFSYTSTGTWYPVPASVMGPSTGVTGGATGRLTVYTTGTYRVDFTICTSVTLAGMNLDNAVLVNGVPTKVWLSLVSPTVGEPKCIGAAGLVPLVGGDVVTVGMRTSGGVKLAGLVQSMMLTIQALQ